MGDSVSIVKRSGGVTEIARGQQIAATQRFRCAANEHAIHDDLAASGKFLSKKFMFGGNVGEHCVIDAVETYGFAFAQIGQRYEGVVSRIEPQNAALCCSAS